MVVQVDLIGSLRVLSSSNGSRTTMHTPSHNPSAFIHHILTACHAFVVCAGRRLAVAQMDELAWPDAAETCSTSASTTRSHGHRRELRHIDTLPRFCGLRAPRSATSALLWLLGPVERELFASGRRCSPSRRKVCRDDWIVEHTPGVWGVLQGGGKR